MGNVEVVGMINRIGAETSLFNARGPYAIRRTWHRRGSSGHHIHHRGSRVDSVRRQTRVVEWKGQSAATACFSIRS